MPRMKRRGSFDSSCNWDEVSIAEESSQPRSARRPSIGGFFSNSDDGASGDNNSSASSLFSELEDYEYALKSNASGPPPTRTQVKLKLSGDHHHHHHHHRNPNTTVWMRNTRIGIFLILFLVMTACASTTYFLTRSYQDEYYQQKFERYASDIQTVLNIHMETIVLETYNSAFGWSSLATDQQWTWPFVTIPHFEQRGQHLIQLMSSSGTMASQNCSMMSLNVMVHPQQRLEWETYSVEHQGWVQQGLDYSFQQQPNNNSTSKALPIPPKIHPNNNNDINNMTTTHTQFHGVTWQVVPAPQNPTMVNYDTLSAPGMEGFVKSLQTQMPPLLTGILQQPLNNQSAASSSSTLTQPIYQYNLQNIKVLVGYLQATFSWESMFANALPEGVPPLQILLENTCDDETVTLQVHGPSVTLLGDDNSNIQEDDDTISLTVPLNHTITNSYLLEPLRNAVQDSSPIQNTDNYNHYNGTNHHHNCFYEFTIYPTFKFRETYTNSNISPRNSTMGVIFVFVLAGTVFAIHDACISKQTAKVEKAGARTDAIVSSLFPDQVRDRMLLNTSSNHTNDGYNSNHSRDGTNTSHKRRARKIQEFYKQGPSKTLRNIFEGQKEETVTEEEEEQDIASKLLQTKPIADLFPNATVLFADIAGFTLWSSEREPTDVFVLLETLYGAMDKLANKYRIFKVETIGDCYVAVTGLPEPRDDHAVVMAKFAVKVLEKIKLVLSQELLDALGPDVTNLAMRFGLHSGPVTAGVLRGEKSRFQLFGDTVNTAARHETTGKPNCIHLSATTAQLLKQGGKEIWIQKRKDEVKAKGKGRMITYWLTLPQTAQVFKQLAFMKDRSYRMRKYENVFLGSQAVDALVYNGLATSRTNAIQLGRALAKELGLFKHSMDPTELFDDDDNFYEFKDPIDENDKKPEWASVWDPECGILADPILQFDSSMSNEADVFLRCLDIRDRKQPLVTYKNCFIGSEAVDALVLSGYCLTREKAVDFGRKLEQELSLFGSVTGGYDFQDENFLYRLSDVFQERSRNAQMFLSIRESLNHELLDSKVDAFKNCVLPLVRHRNHHMKAYKNVFVGEEAIDAMVYTGMVNSRKEAIHAGRMLAKECHLFAHVNGEHAFSDDFFLYHFLDLHQKEEKFNAQEALDHYPATRSELGMKADSVKRLVDVRDRKDAITHKIITHRNCFIASEAIDAMVYSGLSKTRLEAEAVCKSLAEELRLFRPTSGAYEFEDDYLFFSFREDSGVKFPRNLLENSKDSPYLDILRRKGAIFKKLVEVKDRKYRFRTYKQCFVGQDAVDALLKAGMAETRMEATELGRALAREICLLEHVCGDHTFGDGFLFFRFSELTKTIGESEPESES